MVLKFTKKVKKFYVLHAGIGMATLSLLMFVFSLLNNVKTIVFLFDNSLRTFFFKSQALSERIEVDPVVPEFSQRLPDQESVDFLDSSNNNILVASSFLKNSSSSTTSTVPPSLGYASILFNILFYLF